MSSRLSSRPACLFAVAVVFALISSLFAAVPAHAAGTSISGKVTKPSGSALGGSVVDLYGVYTDGLNDYFEFEKSVNTRSDGTYSFTSLPRGTYVVQFGVEEKTYAAEFWSNEKEIQSARQISLGSSAVSGVNGRLAVGGTMRGRVTTEGPDPHGVADAQVAAYRNDSDGWTFDKYAMTAPDGTFEVKGLTDGRFILEFNPPTEGPDADLALEYWNNKRFIHSENDVWVPLGETRDGFDAALAPGGRISGRVTGPNGEPVAGAPVFSYPDGPDVPGNIAITEDDGTYVMKGLSPGNHRLEFYGPYGFGDGYASEWWNDHATFEKANAIAVVAGETTAGKDAQLAADGTPIANTVPPTITGTPKVAERLTADPGSWASEPSELEYQWFADGSPIADADYNIFTVEAAQVGKAITVEVTASRPGFESGTARSASTTPVAKGTFMNKRPPSLDSATRVGDRTYVDSGWWEPGSPYIPRWAYQLVADGEDVPGATAPPFEVTPDMLGKQLALRVDLSLEGFEPASATSEPTAPMLPGLLTPTAKPTLSGDAMVGEPVTASTGTWDQSGQTDKELGFGYQWLVDGTEVTGAKSADFTPSAEHEGKSLTVEVTASRPGYTSVTSVSVPTTVNKAGPQITSGANGPSISGTPSLGYTLTADTGDWNPTPSRFAYQWLADGVAIDGATGSAFRPTAAEGGKRISVRVKASLSGYTSGTATSAETEPVRTSTPFGAPRNLEATSIAVTYIDLSWTKVDGAAKYRIYSGIGSGTRTRLEVGNVTSARIKGLRQSTTYSIDIAALKSDGTRSPYSPRINVRTMPLVPPTELKVTGQTSTSLTLTWTKVAGVPKYRIWYGIGSGTRTKVEVGSVGTTTITGLKPGTTYSFDIASLLSDGSRSSYTPRVDGTTTN